MKPSRLTGAVLTMRGVSAHPGFAKGRMENALKIASRIVERLAARRRLTRDHGGARGFLHPTDLQATLESARLSFIVRDFNADGLREKEACSKQSRRTSCATFRSDLRDSDRGSSTAT